MEKGRPQGCMPFSSDDGLLNVRRKEDSFLITSSKDFWGALTSEMRAVILHIMISRPNFNNPHVPPSVRQNDAHVRPMWARPIQRRTSISDRGDQSGNAILLSACLNGNRMRSPNPLRLDARDRIGFQAPRRPWRQ